MRDETIGAVAVIGAGAMGAGIAQVFAEKGFETRLFDPYPESLKRGINQIEDFWKRGIEPVSYTHLTLPTRIFV